MTNCVAMRDVEYYFWNLAIYDKKDIEQELIYMGLNEREWKNHYKRSYSLQPSGVNIK